jgi:hypothetical protein
VTEIEQDAALCTASGCTQPQAAGALLCPVDVRKLGDWLARIGTEYELLSAVPSMQGREVGTIGGATLASHRSPGNTHVMALRARQRGTGRIGWDDADVWGLDDTPSVYETLASWAARVREDRQLTPPRLDLAYRRRAAPAGPVCDPAGPRCGHHTCEVWTFRTNVAAPLTVATERALLAVHLDWITGQDWAGEFYDEIRGLWVLLLKANGHAAPSQRVTRLQAPCPACGVRAVTHRHGDDLMECQSCHASEPYMADGERLSA